MAYVRSTTPDLNHSAPEPSVSLPILKHDKVISDTWYALRLCPDEEKDYAEKDIEALMDMFCDKQYIFCREKGTGVKGKLHYHCVFPCYKDTDGLKEDINIWLRTFYTDKWKKEDGNKRSNCKPCEDTKQAITYILKDKTFYVGEAINPEYITECSKKSYKKYSKAAFTEEWQKIQDLFNNDEITKAEIRTRYILLKATYKQSINIVNINSQLMAIYVRKDPELAKDL